MIVYKTAEFAKKIGVNASTLARWDKKNVLNAYRTPTNRRYYTEEQYLDYCLKSGIPPDKIETDYNNNKKDSD